MKLKRLIIQGFKSFKDRTVIHFDDGITGIVGPNGCGKSNIVDALFWVMGEQSAKHLRGSNMKDLIFSGSDKYTPAAWAEATLVLDNPEGKHIHVGNHVCNPTEIQLTRKLYRNGETEYRINGNPCRLKDVQEVFMDTGAGAKSYSIIAQGEINRLVQAKPEERRVMIEEVAGITKFKLRRRESLKKIEQTQVNLARLQDLKIEIEKNLKQLEKQAEKAERAKSLKERIRKYELLTESHKEFELLKDIREHQTALSEKRLLIQNSGLEKSRLEVSLEEERIEREDQTVKLDELQAEYNTISRQLAACEERLNHLCKSQSDKERLFDEREKEVEELKGDLENRQTRLAELLAEYEALEQGQDEDVDFQEMEEKLQFMKGEISSKEDELKVLSTNIYNVKKELEKLEGEKFRATSKIEEYATNLQDIITEIEVLEKQYSGVSTELTGKREEAKTLEKILADLGSKEEVAKASFAQKRQALGEHEEQLKGRLKNLMQVEGKLKALEDINQAMEGIKEGTKEFLNSNPGEKFLPLWDLIGSEQNFGRAVGRALSEVLDSVLALDGASSIEAIGDEYLQKGLDVFIPVESDVASSNQETLERLKLFGIDEVVPLSQVVTFAGHGNSLKALLQGHFLVSNLNSKICAELASDLKIRSLTSFDGVVHYKRVPGGKHISLSPEGSNGAAFVERNNVIKQLRQELEAQSAEKEELEKSVVILQVENRELEDSIESIRKNLQSERDKWISINSWIETKVQSFEMGFSRLDILKNRKNEISKSRLELLEKEETFAGQESTLKQQVDQQESDLFDLKEGLEILKHSYENDRSEYLRIEANKKGLEARLASALSQISDIKNQIQKIESKIESSIALKEKYLLESEEIANDLQGLEESNLKTANELQDKEEILFLLKDRLAELLVNMQGRENQVKELGQKISKAEKDVVEHEIKIKQCLTDEDQIVRDIFEKYRINLRSVLSTYLEYTADEMTILSDITTLFFMESENGPIKIYAEAYEFVRRYGQDLKDCYTKFKDARTELSRLGEINWQAIEDYDRQKLRFDFLAVQEGELKVSMQDLQLAIERIDSKSRERFKSAFAEVDERFQKVFPIIFGGGTAKLNLTGDLDDPECGVDIAAQPPGKKMQNINLMSGGEKAMTAVSLIFSIFLVKPSPFCLLDEVDAPLDDANVGRFNLLLREMSNDSQFILITHNKKTMELNDTLYGVTMQEPGISKAVSVQLH